MYSEKGNKNERDAIIYRISFVFVPSMIDFYTFKKSKYIYFIQPGMYLIVVTIDNGQFEIAVTGGGFVKN